MRKPDVSQLLAKAKPAHAGTTGESTRASQFVEVLIFVQDYATLLSADYARVLSPHRPDACEPRRQQIGNSHQLCTLRLSFTSNSLKAVQVYWSGILQAPETFNYGLPESRDDRPRSGGAV